MRAMLTALCATAAVFAATNANATTVIDFSEFTHDAGDLKLSSQFESQGFTFDMNVNSAQSWVVYGKNDSRNADPGGATLMSNLLNTTTRITRTDSGLFDLLSIDLADLFNVGQTTWVQFSFTDALGARTSEFRQLDATKGLETFALNQTNLRAFDYSFVVNHTPGASGWGQADNITLAPVAGAVPEPATWAMMILGFGAAGATLRRRRQAFAARYPASPH